MGGPKDFELSEESQKAIGINSDFSDRTEEGGAGVIIAGEEAEPDKTDKSDKTDKTDKVNNEDKTDKEDKSKSDKTKDDSDESGKEKSKETQDTEQLKGSEGDDKDDKDNENDKDDEDLTDEERSEEFLGQVKEILDKQFTGVDSREQLLEDLANHGKFMAKNTQKSQALAEQQKAQDAEHEAFISRFASTEVVEAVEAIKKLDDYDEFMENVDIWYPKEEGGNKFRTLLDLLFAKTEDVKTFSAEQKKNMEDRASLDLEKQIVELTKLDSAYSDDESDALETLANYADKLSLASGVPLNLVQAYKIRNSDTLGEKAKEQEGEIKKLNKRIKNLEKDLITASEKKQKEGPPSTGITDESGLPMNFKPKDTAEGARSFDEIEKDVKGKLIT